MTSNLDETLYFNGINGATGEYFFEPQSVSEFSKIAQESIIAEQVNGDALSDRTQDKHLRALEVLDRSKEEGGESLKPIEGVEHNDLSKAGWGIIFPANIEPEIRSHLGELIEHRKQEAGNYYKEYEIYGEITANEFLNEYDEYQVYPEKKEPGSTSVFEPADPRKVPYYLLIVGDFEQIPFEFQYQLDVQYAVGRIYFENPSEYAQYAHNVVKAEKDNLSLPCRVNLFGVSNSGDRATQQSTDYLIKPLEKFLTSDEIFLKNNSHWQIQPHIAEEATKAQLSQILSSKEIPALLFTASHGIAFPKDDPRQLPHQGAFICQDWPGPNFGEPIPVDHYFSADDIGDDANLLGLISFHFACFGAGTPQKDEFGHRNNNYPEIAPRSFMAKLPQKLLSKGALAFVGHVDRAWGYSFGGKKGLISTFTDTLQRLTEGNTIGYAVECFNERYAGVSTELTKDLWRIKAGKKSDDYHLSLLWTTNNDARGYAIIGDPAVRLMVGNNASKLVEQRPEFKPVEFSPVQSNNSDKLDESDVTPEQNLAPENPPENPIEKELSNLVNELNQLSLRVERLKQKNLTEDNLSELKFSLKSFNRTLKELEEK
jgi:hypothetical protein